jgi:hypothetical protein
MGLDISVCVQRYGEKRWMDVPVTDTTWCRRDTPSFLFLRGCCEVLTGDYFDEHWPSDELPGWYAPKPGEKPFPEQPRGFPADFAACYGDGRLHGDRYYPTDNWYHHGKFIGSADKVPSWITHAELLGVDEMQRNLELIGRWTRLLDEMALGDPGRTRVVFGFS